ncbi:MAG: hypothetical protein ABJA33_07595 [Pedococcus sp.]
MGKHARRPPRRSGPVTIVAVLVVLLAGAGVWTVLSNGGASADGAPAKPAASGASPSPTTSEPPTTSPSPTNSESPATDAALAKAQASIRACSARIAAGERIADAAAASARDWGTHAGAQLELDKGTYTVAQTEAVWGSSKAGGPGEVKEFAAATAAAKATTTACATVLVDTRGTALADGGTACAARSKALAAVQTTGTKVNAQWAEHLVMMASKAHTDGAAYHRRWLVMVESSQTLLKGYRGAARAMAAAPACRV